MKNLMDKHLVDSVYISKEEQRKLAVQLLLSSIGEDIYREGLKDTPDRVMRMYEEIFFGYMCDPKEILARDFDAGNYQDMILVKDIPFYSHCEHHMVPFFGVAHIAYVPEERVVGISKLARLVECFGRRLQIQERLTSQIADTIEEVLQPKGVGVVVTAEHMCMTMRGVQKLGSKTTTSAMRGVFFDEPEARAELLSLIK